MNQVDVSPDDAVGSAEARAQRHLSHALVEIARFRWWPFSTHSAILLDISLGGFKAEVTGKINIKAGDAVWFKIPLRPWGIYSPSRFVVEAEVRWVDAKRSRVGATFFDLTSSQQRILEQVIGALTSRGDGI